MVIEAAGVCWGFFFLDRNHGLRPSIYVGISYLIGFQKMLTFKLEHNGTLQRFECTSKSWVVCLQKEHHRGLRS